ncbi:hypothetical protein Plhal304r1_c034g0106241 [Plasmopara halstedii]
MSVPLPTPVVEDLINAFSSIVSAFTQAITELTQAQLVLDHHNDSRAFCRWIVQSATKFSRILPSTEFVLTKAQKLGLCAHPRAEARASIVARYLQFRE